MINNENTPPKDAFNEIEQLLSQGNYTEAIASAKSLLEEFPECNQAHHYLWWAVFDYFWFLLWHRGVEAASPWANRKLEIAERYCRFAPNDPLAHRDRAMSISMLGKVAQERGDRNLAEELYQKASNLCAKLLQHYPDNNLIKSDSCTSLQYLFDIQLENRRIPEARSTIEQCLRYASDLLKASPREIKYSRMISLIYERLAKLEREAENAGDALKWLQKSVESSRFVVSLEPSREHLRGLATSLAFLADFVDGKNAVMTKASYEEALEIWRTLLEIDPDSAIANEDISIGLQKLGALAVKSNEFETAIQLGQERLKLNRAFLSRHPGDPDARNRLARALTELGRATLGMKHVDEALAFCRESFPISQRLIQEFPAKIDYLENLRFTYLMLAIVAESKVDTYNEQIVFYNEIRKVTADYRKRAIPDPHREYWDTKTAEYIEEVNQKRQEARSQQGWRRWLPWS